MWDVTKASCVTGRSPAMREWAMNGLVAPAPRRHQFFVNRKPVLFWMCVKRSIKFPQTVLVVSTKIQLLHSADRLTDIRAQTRGNEGEFPGVITSLPHLPKRYANSFSTKRMRGNISITPSPFRILAFQSFGRAAVSCHRQWYDAQQIFLPQPGVVLRS